MTNIKQSSKKNGPTYKTFLHFGPEGIKVYVCYDKYGPSSVNFVIFENGEQNPHMELYMRDQGQVHLFNKEEDGYSLSDASSLGKLLMVQAWCMQHAQFHFLQHSNYPIEYSGISVSAVAKVDLPFKLGYIHDDLMRPMVEGCPVEAKQYFEEAK